MIPYQETFTTDVTDVLIPAFAGRDLLLSTSGEHGGATVKIEEENQGALWFDNQTRGYSAVGLCNKSNLSLTITGATGTTAITVELTKAERFHK